MKTNTTQKQIVLKQLQENGVVTRNWALDRYISRLGAIIHKLNTEGYEIVAVSKNRHKDYGYKFRN